MSSTRIPLLSPDGMEYIHAILGSIPVEVDVRTLSQGQIEELLIVLEAECALEHAPDDRQAITGLAAVLTRAAAQR